LESFKTLFSDFLQGGYGPIFLNPNVKKTISVPKNNKFSETVFGHVDRILREKPNISTIAQEAYIMFYHNKTLRWLDSKDNSEKAELLAAARKDFKRTRLQFKQRRIEIEQKRNEILKQKFLEIVERERKQVEKLESLTSGI
jgi:hypothetical protein